MGKHKKKSALASFGHSFPLFHHNTKPSPKSSPKFIQSAPGGLGNVEATSNGSLHLMAHDSTSESGSIHSVVNNGYMTDGEDVRNVDDVRVNIQNNKEGE